MKFLIVLLAGLSLALAGDLTEEQKAMLRQHVDQCMQQEGLSQEQALAVRNDNVEDVDDKVKCFANCFMEKIGFIVDGQLKPDVVQEKLVPLTGADNVKNVLAKCDSVKGADKCDTGYQIHQCFHKNHAFL